MKSKVGNYWSLIKSLQTGLLLLTGLSGYMSARCPVYNLSMILGISGSLFLAISGSTVLNMWYDRDIDAKMNRTCWRPIPSGKVKPIEALILGLSLSVLGVGWAFFIDTPFGVVIFLGLFFDVAIYTIWLKRRTAWSIVWGGLSGGMPILAGRVVGIGHFDWIGICLMFAIVFWIPTHNLTFSMRYFDDYRNAGIPTFSSVFGFSATRKFIAISSILAAIAMVFSAIGIGAHIGYLRVLALLSIGLLVLAMSSLLRPSEKINFSLFKYASLYMISSMLLIAVH